MTNIMVARDSYGEPVCADCGAYFATGSRAMVVDGEIVCFDCLKKWAEDDFSDFMLFMADKKREILFERDIEELVEEENEQERITEEEMMREIMTAREIGA